MNIHSHALNSNEQCNHHTFLMFLFFTVPSSPQSFSLSPVAGQLSASWSEPITKNGIITGYSVYCNTSANQSYQEQVIGSNVPTIRSVVNETTLAVMLTGLNPYTQYSCYVTANTSVGEGSPSVILTVQTAQSGNSFNHLARSHWSIIWTLC